MSDTLCLRHFDLFWRQALLQLYGSLEQAQRDKLLDKLAVDRIGAWMTTHAYGLLGFLALNTLIPSFCQWVLSYKSKLGSSRVEVWRQEV